MKSTTAAALTDSSCKFHSLWFAGSSFLISSGLGLAFLGSLHANHANDEDWDFSEAGALVRAAAEIGFRWASLSAVASAIGFLAILLRRASVLRIFAIGSAIDLLCTILLLSVLCLVTFSPMLAQPFSNFLCTAITTGDLFPGSSVLNEKVSRVGQNSLGVELVGWGVENCEERWRIWMIVVILGCTAAVGLRAWGVWIIWDHYAHLIKYSNNKSLQANSVESDWTSEADYKPKSSSSRRSSSSHSRRNSHSSHKSTTRTPRSATLPPTSIPPLKDANGTFYRHTRAQTFSSGTAITATGTAQTSNRPRLVLVPVVIDDSSAAPSSYEQLWANLPNSPRLKRASRNSISPPRSNRSATPTNLTETENVFVESPTEATEFFPEVTCRRNRSRSETFSSGQSFTKKKRTSSVTSHRAIILDEEEALGLGFDWRLAV